MLLNNIMIIIITTIIVGNLPWCVLAKRVHLDFDPGETDLAKKKE